MLGDVYLSQLLKRRGFRVVNIDSHPNGIWWMDWLLEHRPMVVILHSINELTKFIDHKEQHLDQTYKPYKIVLPTEGTIFYDETERQALHKNLDKNWDFTLPDLYFCWNQIEIDELPKNTELDRSVLELASHQRFDLHRKPLNSICPPRKALLNKYNIPTDRDWKIVTVAFNFPHCEKEAQEGQMKADIWDNQLPEGFGYDDVIDRHYTDRKEMKQFVKKIVDKFSNVWVLAKPHPLSRDSSYTDIMNYERCTLLRTDFIHNMLSISDLLIHYKCTSMLEAWLADVPALNFANTDMHEIWKREVNHGPFDASNSNEALKMVRQILNSDEKVPLRK
ncbi:MAG: hypothetical protein ABEH43_02865, partial [Flavobacteriales bacterium]